MTGTLVNAAAIVVGGAIGLLIKKGIPKRLEQALMTAEGLAIFIIGLNGVLVTMLRADSATGRISDSGGLLLLGSLVLGTLAGELLHIHGGINRLGAAVERRVGAAGFQQGFVSASILFCVGAMAIVGALSDGLKGDSSVLFVKSALDGVTALIMASSLGAGVLFSALPVLLYQGGIALLAGLLSGVLSGQTLDGVCMVGYTIVLAIGINFVWKKEIRVANMLPALLVPVGYYLLVALL